VVRPTPAQVLSVRACLTLLAAANLVLVAGPAVAQEHSHSQEASDGWSFKLAPYLLGAAVSGSLTINDYTSEVEVGLGEILENLDLAFMMKAEATNGSWSIGLDGFLAGLVYTADRPSSDVNVDQWFVELYGTRTIAPWLKAVVGARYNSVSAEIVFEGPAGRQKETGIDWLDPLVGAQLVVPLGGRWALRGRGDIGGFGVGSKFTWQAQAYVDYQISRVVSIDLGYRAIANDYETNSGDNRFRYDMTLFGPALGVIVSL
jgi:hypothetical protein